MTILIAAPLRLLWLGSYPPGLFYDPAGEGIDALRILQGARPVFLPANNGREPLLNYLMAAVFAATGPTVEGIRLTVALIGIASIPVAFLWARPWFGPRVGLLAATFMAVSTWHLFLSRFGVRAVLLPLVEPLTIALIWRAATASSRACWIAAGLALGLSAYTYLPIRLFPIVAGATLIVVLVKRQAHVRDVALMIFTAALVAFPLAVYFLGSSTELNARVDQISLLGERDAFRKVVESLGRTLGMFLWEGDAWPFTNLPHRPVFDLIVAPFFALGLCVAIARIRRPPYALLLLWLGVMLVPGALAVGAPNSQRTAGMMPAVFVVPALGLATATAWLIRRLRAGRASSRASRIAAYSLVFGVVAASGLLTVRAYFVDLTNAPDLWKWYETDVATLGRWAAGASRDEQVFALVSSLPDVGRAENQHTSMTFSSGRRVWAFEPDQFPIADTSSRPATYLLTDPEDQGARAALPPGKEEWIRDDFSGRTLLAHRIAATTPLQPGTRLDSRWRNGLSLLGWSQVGTYDSTETPRELLLYLAGPAVTEEGVGGRLVVSALDGDGRDRDIVRFTLRSLVCPPYLCGEIEAVARRVFLDPPANTTRYPVTLRVRVVGDDGSQLEAVDGAGRGLGSSIGLARYER